MLCWVIALAIASAMTLYSVYWLFGVWVPWYVSVFGALLGPVLPPFWFVLWVLHFTPVHFPVFAR